MKKLILILVLAFTNAFLHAQTNTFPSTGFVGIGTTNPQFHLDIVGNMQLSSGSIFLPNNGAIYGRDNGGTNRIIWLTGGDNSFAMATLGGGFNFYNKGLQNVMMHIDESGTVGIGTFLTSGHKLAVEGSIGARKVKVTQAAWADFVFEKNYALPSLAEVEAFIAAHKHLPDVPSADEVQANGLDLGEGQAVLLRKIEELTLYLIEQNKKQAIQDKQLTEQEKQLIAQAQLIDALTKKFDSLQAKINAIENKTDQ